MAEKPKIRDTDEIFSSIGKATARQPVPGLEQTPEEETVQSLIDSPLDPPPDPEDRNPLDFSRYQLPRGGRKKMAQPRESRQPTAEELMPDGTSSGAEQSAPAPQTKKQASKKQSAAHKQQTDEKKDTPETPPKDAAGQKSAPKKRSGQSSSAQKKNSVKTQSRSTSGGAGRAKSKPTPAVVTEPEVEEQPAPQVQEYTFEAFDGPQAPDLQPAAQQREESETVAARPETPVREETERPLTPAEQRKLLREQLASQFDQEFSQKFAGEEEKEESPSWFDVAPPVRAKKSPRIIAERDSEPDEDMFDAQPPEPEEDPQEDPFPFVADTAEETQPEPAEELPEPAAEEENREAEEFLSQFEDRVRQEEESRTETFKDTLAEKFMRERERYLKELGIDPDAPPTQEVEFDPPKAEGAFEPPVRRRLDVQIQPEMHTADQTVRPVTYNRGAVATPQDEQAEGELPYNPAAFADGVAEAPVPAKAAGRQAINGAGAGSGGKKTSEQLLLEHAAQNYLRATQAMIGETAKPQAPPPKVRFAPPAAPPAGSGVEKAKERKKISIPVPSRPIAISAVAALVVLALIAWPLYSYFTSNAPDGGLIESGDEIGQQGGALQETLTVYETRVFQTRGHVGDLMVKKSGIELQNLDVDNHLVIDDITTPGTVTLRDLTVGGSVYVRGCAVDELVLEDVTAQRVIVNNPEARVRVRVTGGSGVGTVEFRTSGDLDQTDMQNEASGVEHVVVRANEGTGVIDASLNGVTLQTLNTEGDAVATLGNNAGVLNMTSEGALSLEGDGTVTNLSASGSGEGAQVSLQLKNTSVSRLNLIGPAVVNVDTRIDSVTVSDVLSMGGTGVVGTLYVNPPTMTNRRLAIDLSDVTVHALISDAQTRIDCAGTARINELTANSSVYQLGNKVNHLIARADGVVYENEPDKTTVASGVHQPESVADNPNLDYNLATTDSTRMLDTSDDTLATTCNHSRENGGFVRGDGSRSDPFEVSTPAQLAHVSAHLDSHFILTDNIDISDDSSFASGFEMIAGGGSPFSGVFDGNGYAISNLRISGDGENVGLFAENTGTIRNVHIQSGEVRGTSATRNFVGAVVGLNYNGGVVENCANGANVTGSGTSYAGGIVGYNYGGKIRNCYNAAKITGESNVGGITGVNRDNASINNSYNVGAIDAQLDAGAVAGVNTDATVTNCYYLVETAAEGIGSGSGNVTEKTMDELSSAQMVLDLSGGNDDSPWIRPGSGDSYTFPVLRAVQQTSGLVQQSSSSEEELPVVEE